MFLLLLTILAADGRKLLDVLRCSAEIGSRIPTLSLDSLFELLTKSHPNEKVLIFTHNLRIPFAILPRSFVPVVWKRIAGVTGDDEDPTSYAWRFSPVSNDKRNQVAPEQETPEYSWATDVLSAKDRTSRTCSNRSEF